MKHTKQGANMDSMMKAAGAVAQIRKGSDLIRMTHANLVISVEIARENGATWQQIGDALGVTRSAAQQHYCN